jgi:tRNA(Ile)-lysidine synthase
MQLLDRVRHTIRRYDLARPDTRVVVALSGGSDSVALVHVLRALTEAGELRAVGLAHFNHQLRDAAGEDERFAVRVAESIGWPILVDREDVAARARRERRSIEDAARTARHLFLERARIHFGADVVALGHTRDDQAETFLLRLVRGAGARGLAAMHPRRGSLVRPLIECRRAELRAYLDSGGIGYVEDASNLDVSVPRNRVRQELIPWLEQRFNPAIVDVLAGEADIARQEWRWMNDQADALAETICRRDGDVWRLDLAALNQAPEALGRILVHRTMMEVSGGRPVSFGQVDRALALAREGGVPYDAPGQRLERIGPDLVLTVSRTGAGGRRRPAGSLDPDVASLFRYPLSVPGEVSDAGWVVSAEPAGSADRARAVLGSLAEVGNVGTVGIAGIAYRGEAAAIRGDRFHGQLAVRNRRPGDRFRPLGLQGSKKLQDYLVDKKVARAERDRVPLVVDESDRIIWVAGHSIDEEFRVTDPTQTVLILRFKALGGPA